MEETEEYSLCILCCYSFPGSSKIPPGNRESVDKFIQQIGGEDLKCLSSAGLLEQKDVSVCAECLSQVGKAVGKREQVEEVEVHVRSLQEEILRLMGQLRKLVDGYLEEMRRIEDKVKCSDEQCLRSKFAGRRGRLKNWTWSRENVFQFRDGVLNVVKDLNFYRRDLRTKLLDENQTPTSAKESPSKPIFTEVKTEISACAYSEDTQEPADDFQDFGYSPVAQDNSDSDDYILPNTPVRKRGSRRCSSKPFTYLESDSNSSEPAKREPEVEKTIARDNADLYTNKPSWYTVTRKTFSSGSKGSIRVFTCVSCPDFTARDQFHLEQHLRTHEKSYEDKHKTLICPHCGMAFAHQQYYDFHMYCHSGVFKGACDRCLKYYNTFDLKAHLEKRHGVRKVYECANCVQVHSTKARFIGHMAKHIGYDIIFSCGLCKETFLSRGHLLKHLEEKHPVDKVAQDIPEKTIQEGTKVGNKKSSEDEDDRNVSSSDSDYQPSTSPKKKRKSDFDNKVKVKRVRTKRQGQNTAKPIIPSTPKLKKRRPAWHKIVEEMLPNAKMYRKRYYHCLQCPDFKTKMWFHFEQHLRTHERTTDSTEILSCSYCPQTFKVAQYHEFHVGCHEYVFKSVCDVCNKFCPPFQLKEHLEQDHKLERTFQCSSCIQVLSSREKYLKHLDYHTGKDAQMGCDLCSEIFSKKRLLEEHYNLEHQLEFDDIIQQPQDPKDAPVEHMADQGSDEDCADKPPGYLPLSKRKRPAWFTCTRHKTKNKTDSSYFCLLCPDIKFRQHQSLEHHLRGHESSVPEHQKTFQCPHCPAKFGVEQHYHFHLYHHQGLFQLKCDKCNLSKLALTLKSHMTEEHGVKPEDFIQCVNCTMVHSTRERYISHLIVFHSGQNAVWGCDLCPEGFPGRSGLTKHYNQEHQLQINEESYQRSKANYLKKRKSKDSVICPECGKSLRAESLKDHIECVHSNNARPYKCPVCGKGFKTSGNLCGHSAIHKRDGSGPQFQCHLCSKGFMVKDSFESHMKKHDGTGFTCEKCGAMFGDQYVLKVHLRIHAKNEQIQWWQCPQCPFKYKTKEKLECHLKVHNRPRGNENRCGVCQKVFLKLATLKKHAMAVHSGTKSFICEFCNRAFSGLSNLCAHKRRDHLEEYQLQKKRKAGAANASGASTSNYEQQEILVENQFKGQHAQCNY